MKEKKKEKWLGGCEADHGGGRLHKRGFTLIELIVVMAVIGILVLLAAPKFLGYTERAKETKHIHTAKVIETALEAYLINGGAFPDDLEVVNKTLLEESAGKESLIGVNGYITKLDEDIYYELTYDFIQKLDIKVTANNEIVIEASASSLPAAVYASKKGKAIVDKEKPLLGLKGDQLLPAPDDNSNFLLDGTFYSHPSSLVAMFLSKDGELWSWGRDSFGLLGQGDQSISKTPQRVLLDEKVIDLTLTQNAAFAITENGNAYSWGNNLYGLLGLGNTGNKNTPQKMNFLQNVKQIESTDANATLLTMEGDIWTWGINTAGQMGFGNTTAYTSPRKLNITNVNEILIASSYSIIKKDNGEIWGWGMNTEGQLGLSHNATPKTPTQLNSLSNLKTLQVYGNGLFMIGNDNNIFVWGYNDSSRLGITSLRNYSPILLSRITDIKSINLGSQHTIFLKNDGTIWGTGSNHSGQLGIGNLTDNWILSVREITTISNIVDIKVVGQTNIALKSDGTVWSWGGGTGGRLGIEGYDKLFYPTKIETLKDIIEIKTLSQGFMAIDKDKNIYVWGSNGYGYNLGVGINADILTPTIFQNFTLN